MSVVLAKKPYWLISQFCVVVGFSEGDLQSSSAKPTGEEISFERLLDREHREQGQVMKWLTPEKAKQEAGFIM